MNRIFTIFAMFEDADPATDGVELKEEAATKKAAASYDVHTSVVGTHSEYSTPQLAMQAPGAVSEAPRDNTTI